MLHPTQSATPDVRTVLIHEFPGGENVDLFGLAEVEPDVYYTAKANITGYPENLKIVPGSYTVWKLT